MKIIYVGGIQRKSAFQKFYDTTPKLINGFIREGHQVLYFSDRDTSRDCNIFKSRKLGIKKCNQEFLKVIEQFLPDLLIFKHADIIQSETILEIRQKFPHVKMAQVNVDALFNPDNVERIKKKSGLMDANFITTAGKALEKVKLNNVPVYFMPNPVDASVEINKSFEKDCKNDLFFTCGNAVEGDPRYDIPQRILKEQPDVNFRFAIAGQGDSLWGNQYLEELGQSKMGLNLSRKQEKDRKGNMDDFYIYSSDRVAHYVGNGLLTFTDADFCYNELFNDDEMVFYTSEDDLLEKIKYYKNNLKAAEKIAKKGWEKAHKHYNERLCARYIVEATFGEVKSKFNWPTKPY